jgi:transcriptional regulator with XRE-family HTH domain
VNFGEKLKQLRAERNLTQPQLAQAIGIEQSYLSKLENDKSIPSADIFQSILKAFGIDVATFLDGVDEKQVHRDLRQVPEVAHHLNSVITTRIHDIRAWLFGSGIALVLGLTVGLAGQRGWLFSNKQYNYHSAGVLLPGESPQWFSMHQFQPETMNRIMPDHKLLDDYRGEGFTEEVPGGTRYYTYRHFTVAVRPQNRILMLAGALLTFGGIVGFITEARLRSVRLQA